MQNSIQRVTSVIQEGFCDRIPRGEITIDDSVVMDSLGCRRVGFEERLRFCLLLGADIFCLAPLPGSPSDRLPQPSDLIWPDLKDWVDRSNLFTFAVLDGSFGWGIRIFGFKRFFALTFKDHDKLRDFNAQVERLNRELSARLADRGIHGVILADDIAHSNGLFVGPRATAEHFLPSLSRQAEQILSLGLPLFFHSDGDFMDILPRISAIGFHGLHCVDPDSNMDLTEVRARVGKGLCLWGTLTARELERCADPNQKEGLMRNIRDAASSGSFILGTTSGLFKGLRVDRLRSIYNQI